LQTHKKANKSVQQVIHSFQERKVGLTKAPIPGKPRKIIGKALTGSTCDEARIEDFPVSKNDIENAPTLIGVCRKTR